MPSPLEKYGSTPVSSDERHAFVPGFSAETKQAVDQAEIDGLEATYVKYLSGIVSGRIGMAEMTDWTMAGIWQSAGQIRTSELSIGVDPGHVRQKLGEFMDLVMAYLTDKPVLVLNWSAADLDKREYIAALRHADQAAGDVARVMAMLPPKVALVD